MQTSAGNRFAIALGTGLSLATLSAFAVAPLGSPLRARVIEPVTLNPQVMPAAATVVSTLNASVRNGEVLLDALRRLGRVDAGLVAVLEAHPLGRMPLAARAGAPLRVGLDGEGAIQSLTLAWDDAPVEPVPRDVRARDARARKATTEQAARPSKARGSAAAGAAARVAPSRGGVEPPTRARVAVPREQAASAVAASAAALTAQNAAGAVHAEEPALVRMLLQKRDGAWRAERIEGRRTSVIESRTLNVETTVHAAARDQKVPDGVLSQLGDVFAASFDPRKDVNRGDTLRLVYEKRSDPDELSPPLPGRILAANFDGKQRRLEAVWFDHGQDRGHYYSFEGEPVKARFLETPVAYTRISSGYSPTRRSPLDGVTRAHLGVDYAAPIGTPVEAVGDGSIEFIGVQRGYGNVVILRHDAEHFTLYAHLNKFARKLTAGQTVRKGQHIGDVGRTGWATGPHLHFEIHVNGESVDPVSILPRSVPPLEASDRMQFAAFTQPLRLRLGNGPTAELPRFE